MNSPDRNTQKKIKWKRVSSSWHACCCCHHLIELSWIYVRLFVRKEPNDFSRCKRIPCYNNKNIKRLCLKTTNYLENFHNMWPRYSVGLHILSIYAPYSLVNLLTHQRCNEIKITIKPWTKQINHHRLDFCSAIFVASYCSNFTCANEFLCGIFPKAINHNITQKTIK